MRGRNKRRYGSRTKTAARRRRKFRGAIRKRRYSRKRRAFRKKRVSDYTKVSCTLMGTYCLAGP